MGSVIEFPGNPKSAPNPLLTGLVSLAVVVDGPEGLSDAPEPGRSEVQLLVERLLEKGGVQTLSLARATESAEAAVLSILVTAVPVDDVVAYSISMEIIDAVCSARSPDLAGSGTIWSCSIPLELCRLEAFGSQLLEVIAQGVAALMLELDEAKA